MAKFNGGVRKARRPFVTSVHVFTGIGAKATAAVEFVGAVAMRSFWLTAIAGLMVLAAEVLAK
jgi:hypothetical protein